MAMVVHRLAIGFSAGLYDKHTTLLKQALRDRIVFTQMLMGWWQQYFSRYPVWYCAAS